MPSIYDLSIASYCARLLPPTLIIASKNSTFLKSLTTSGL